MAGRGPWLLARLRLGWPSFHRRSACPPREPLGAQPDRAAGQSAVELALLLPVLALILMGIIDLGRVFYTYEALANAAREGARHCALHPGDTSGTQTRVTNELDGKIVADTSSTICASPGGGNQVDVSVQADFSPVTPLIQAITGSTMIIQATASMVVWQ